MDLALAAAAITPTTLATERALPVDDAWGSLLPDGLVRGRTVTCTGLTAPSAALSLLTAALRTGAWLAVVDVPWLGLEAARDLGVPVERLVRVDTAGASGHRSPELWAEALAAAVDGFDCLLTRVPPRTPAGLTRRLQTRLRHREGVLVTLGDPDSLVPDLTVSTDDVRWDGLGHGHGHLRRRRITAAVTGRRAPRPRRAALCLPAADGRATADDGADIATITPFAPATSGSGAG